MHPDNLSFKDRIQAGEELGHKLIIRNFPQPVILALPRGGVIVADEVARILGAPLDVVIARKIGAPGHQEFGIGAISEDEVPHFNHKVMGYLDITSAAVRPIVEAEISELRRRIGHYRGGRELPELKGKTIIVIDDGLATGVTAWAAGAFLRTCQPKELIFAAPVCPETISAEVGEQYDEVICLKHPRNFQSVGMWYEDFRQVEDEEVMSILNRHHVSAHIHHHQKDNLSRM